MENHPLIEEHTRRSNRKTKKIDRTARESHIKQVSHRHLIEEVHYGVAVEIQSRCRRWMQVDSDTNQQFILEEMNRAIGYQCQKLESVLKIKLQLGQKEPSEPQECSNPIPKWPLANMILPHQMEPPEGTPISPENDQSFDYWSCQEQEREWPVLRRHQSARLLCDNYEKQELIYSVETLIPRLARQDIDQDLIERLH